MASYDDLLAVLSTHQGWATFADLHPWRHSLPGAVAAGVITRVGYGRYAAADADRHLVAALHINGARAQLSAALAHGWPVARPPSLPVVAVPRSRVVSSDDRRRAQVMWSPLTECERRHHLTTPMHTILTCARTLPLSDALAVADSALRARDVTAADLRAEATALRGPGSARARQVASSANALAANPFESVLRGLALDAGLTPEPQVEIRAGGVVARVDLLDRKRRLVMEADSFEWHGNRAALDRDADRYSRLTAAGWRVMRFSWEAVFLRAEVVRQQLLAAARAS